MSIGRRSSLNAAHLQTTLSFFVETQPTLHCNLCFIPAAAALVPASQGATKAALQILGVHSACAAILAAAAGSVTA